MPFRGEKCPACGLRFSPGRYDDHVAACGGRPGGAPLHRVRSTPFIHRFDKTPANCVCPGFSVLAWGHGCPYNCAYCYLAGTFRMPGDRRVVYQNGDDLLAQVAAWMDATAEPSVLNAGELADAMAWQTRLPEWYWVGAELVRLFAAQTKHFLLLVTKACCWPPGGDVVSAQVINSWTVNTSDVWRQWEEGTPSPDKRMRAVSRAIEDGYRVRVRFDPIHKPVMEPNPQHTWTTMGDLCQWAVGLGAGLEGVTLGTLRASPQLKGRWPLSMSEQLTELPQAEGDKLRIPFAVRQRWYARVLKTLPGVRVALCKETRDMWTAVGLDPAECRCNCTV